MERAGRFFYFSVGRDLYSYMEQEERKLVFCLFKVND